MTAQEKFCTAFVQCGGTIVPCCNRSMEDSNKGLLQSLQGLLVTVGQYKAQGPTNKHFIRRKQKLYEMD
jgi:hypothetical protein